MTYPASIATASIGPISRDYDLVQFQMDTFAQLSSANIAYLAVTVSALVGLAALGALLFYFFNIKPLLVRLKKQETALEALKADISGQIVSMIGQFNAQTTSNEEMFAKLVENQKTSLNSVITKLNQLEKDATKKIEGLTTRMEALSKEAQEKINELEVLREWQNHYIWRVYKLPLNEFRSLNTVLRDIQHYNLLRWLEELALDEIDLLFKHHKADLAKEKEKSKKLITEFYLLLPNINKTPKIEGMIDSIKKEIVNSGLEN